MNEAERKAGSRESRAAQRLAEESAEWVLTMKHPTLDQRAAFATWVTRSPRHIEEFLIASSIDEQLLRIGPARINEVIRRSQCRIEAGVAAAEGVDEEALAGRLREKYRRSLLQVFLKRRVTPDAAENLIHQAFCVTAEHVRNRRFREESEVAEYLYRLSCNLATSYWEGEVAREKVLRGEVSAMA